MTNECNQSDLQSLQEEIENLSTLCEEHAKSSGNSDKQRFYEGMAIAYTTVIMKLKKQVQQIDSKVIDELFQAIEKTSKAKAINGTPYSPACSFCQRDTAEVGELAVGPGVSICKECLEFGADLIKRNSTKC